MGGMDNIIDNAIGPQFGPGKCRLSTNINGNAIW